MALALNDIARELDPKSSDLVRSEVALAHELGGAAGVQLGQPDTVLVRDLRQVSRQRFLLGTKRALHQQQEHLRRCDHACHR